MGVYPFGLIQQGISSKALGFGGGENKKKYVGNELQNKEFSDGSGIELYDFNARTYDQQIGRFIQVDPLSEEEDQEDWSPYHYSYNNPVTYSDPDGKFPIPIIWAIVAWLASDAAVTTATVTVVAATTTVAVVKTVENIQNADLASGTERVSFGGSAAQIDNRVEMQLRAASRTSTSSTGKGAVAGGIGAQAGRALAKGTQNPKVKEAIQEGNAKHNELKEKVKNKVGWKSEPVKTDQTTNKKLKPDVETPSGNLIELKPNTPSGRNKGATQKQKYENGTKQKTRVIYYDPKQKI